MASTIPVARPSVLVVWDFDWSLVNENSDSWVVEQLGEELTPEFRRLQEEEHLGWTQIMSRQMRSLWEKGVKEDEIKKEMTRLPVFEEMLEAVRSAARAGASQAIVSDANKVFIEEFVHHHGIRRLFTKGISTNGGVFTDDGRLDVTPCHESSLPPHGCPLCPPNMCKGLILDGLLSVSPDSDGQDRRAVDKVIYVGDGGGDYCPALRLKPGDLVLARDGGEDGRLYGLRRRIENEEGGPLACRLLLWENGAHVLKAIENELKEPQTLDTTGQ
ncbi:unnamed protein product [Ascophyllum nodosum]